MKVNHNHNSHRLFHHNRMIGNPASKTDSTSAPAAAAAAAASTAMDTTTDDTMSGEMEKKIQPFLLADIGEGIAEVEITTWYVSEGDEIQQFDKVCEVNSDKASVEITSRYDGVVKALYAKVGEMVEVGAPLIDIEIMEEKKKQGSSSSSSSDNNNSNQMENDSSSSEIKSKKEKKDILSTVINDDDDDDDDRSVLTTSSSGYGGKKNSMNNGDGNGNMMINQMKSGGGAVLCTPAVRKIAKENEIDLSMIHATGPRGRILKQDIYNFMNGNTNLKTFSFPAMVNRAKVSAKKKSDPSPTHIFGEDITQEEDEKSDGEDGFEEGGVGNGIINPFLNNTTQPGQKEIVPIRGMQRQMVKAMNATLSIPHFEYKDEINMDSIWKFRKALNVAPNTDGVKITFLPIIMKATSLSLLKFPILNASVSSDESEMHYHNDHNLGFAMDTPMGLMVPIIKQVQYKSIFEIAYEINELQKIGSRGQFTEQHLKGGTFTLSNIGSIGGTYMGPKIMVPQVCIGALGKIQKLPRYDEADNVIPTRIMNISWAGDHRVIDGATMARFSNMWKGYLEDPVQMLAHTR